MYDGAIIPPDLVTIKLFEIIYIMRKSVWSVRGTSGNVMKSSTCNHPERLCEWWRGVLRGDTDGNCRWWRRWRWCVSGVRGADARPDDGMCLILSQTWLSCCFLSCMRGIYLRNAKLPYLWEASPAAGHRRCPPVARRRDKDLPCTWRSQSHSKAGWNRRMNALSSQREARATLNQHIGWNGLQMCCIFAFGNNS